MKISILFFLFVFIWISCGQRKVEFEITDADVLLFQQAKQNAYLAKEGFVNSRNYMMGWIEYSDPKSLLIPRNLEGGKDFWNAKDAAADNYPFMVLTSFFVDQEMFDGRMMEMLSSEKALTSRVKSLPDSYSFSKQGFLTEEINMDDIIFGTSEYIKDGLLPLTEWLGSSPWSERMIEMLVDLNEIVDVTTVGDEKGNVIVPQNEVNGEMLQVLSRIYWMTGEETFLEWAIQIGDYYLLGDHHPTRDLEYLRLRDHGCELISGLCELYITTNYARPGKIPAGSQFTSSVSALDIAPTFSALAKTKQSDEHNFDGVNLIPYILEESSEEINRDLMWRFTVSAAIRHEQWKLIRLPDRLPLLYDLSKDISEQHNIALEHIDITNKLLKKIGDWDVAQPHPVFLEGAVWKRRQLDLYDASYPLTQPN